ncbi:head vertex assembly chaperone [Morganella phage vB_MmoM_MP1]|uniref:Head vertex assembly chaperone n=1 Tax=Morganella phage vB_MmoM_MP1 TaxID=1852628 RepID=A0A192YAJ0_9CAUD|nr:head vertex assembly chaperone [Morganella phage vB_MmoM_MP1]ANM46552.1 head vertex assembly chaperone [Morganella phage vB_MmoM_MP1]
MELTEEELLELDKFDETPAKENNISDKSVFDKSLGIIKEAMDDVLQEMVIIIDDEPHLVYIQSLDINNGKVEFTFSTLSDIPRDVLIPHIENCIKAQIEQFKPKSFLQRLFW